jgi:hypothetical protein
MSSSLNTTNNGEMSAPTTSTQPNDIATQKPQEYTWHDWRKDNEDLMWSLFWAVSKTVDDNKLPFLDQLEFSDFVQFCRKYTSEPHPPDNLQNYDDDGDSVQDEQHNRVNDTNIEY